MSENKKDLPALSIVTLVDNTVQHGTPESCGPRASAALVFDSYEDAEAVLQLLAKAALAAARKDLA